MTIALASSGSADPTRETLWQDGGLVLRRWTRRGSPAVLLLTSERAQPPPGVISRLEHAWSLHAVLDAAWATRPLELLQLGDRPALVLEDPGGTVLATLVGRPWPVEDFLRAAIAIASALGGLHARGLVHKDVKPANVLLDLARDTAWLTGFGLASRLPRERRAPDAPQAIAGTLAYMAPEQTGRMNRSIDSRSDLYALGATFYEMLTGELPFVAADPLEWVHCHIAREPVPVAERAPVPEQISAIVARLLAKTADERYQTAAGLEADLRRCLTAWREHGEIAPFALGAHDVSGALLLPERLYEREVEAATLRAAFDRVVDGPSELVLVSGYSGVGKSAVVSELQRALVSSRGFFAAGKFDQLRRDIPYATLAQAFRSLLCDVLARSEAEVARWREDLAEALGPNGQLVVDLVPELELLIGAQPPVAPLPPRDAQARFQTVLHRFVGVFARAEHPLVVFLDDLQWADAATLSLLEHLVTGGDLRHLLLIGAYRDNEVDAAHPLRRVLATVRGGGARVTEIVVAPLALDHVARLIGDAFGCAADDARPLAELVHAKTAGNPFFTIQFLTTLHDEQLLAFVPALGRWIWDLDRIRAKGFTDNVVELMAAKLTRLSPASQHALQMLACLGNASSAATLALASDSSEEEVHVVLWDAVHAGLVLRADDTYRFAHDRVQEAAYALLPADERPARHLAIGRRLAAGLGDAALEERVFEVVQQLERGSALLADQDERDRFAELSLLAGKRAKASTAYASALGYLRAGRALLADDAWQRRYALVFGLELHLAECLFLTGDFAGADERLTALALRAEGLVDRAAVASLHVSLCTTLDRSDRAVEICLAYLRLVGVEWSAHPTDDEVRREYERMWQQLGDRPIEDLIDLPTMTDPVACATLDVLTAVQPPALFTDENLLRLVIGRMANLSLEHGNGDGSCFAFVHLSTVLGARFGDYAAAARFGRLGVDLVEKRGFDRFRARVYLSFANVVSPWMLPVAEGLDWLRRALDAAQETGDLTFAAYARNTAITFRLIAGAPLADLQEEAESALAWIRAAGFGLVADTVVGPLALIRSLRGVPDDLDERRFEEHLDANPRLAVVKCRYGIRKLQARFFAGDFAGAVAAATQAAALLWTSLSFFESAEYHFFAALARAAFERDAPEDERPRLREQLAVHRSTLATWAEHCPANFAARAALVAAEVARVEGRELDAERGYEEAIALARSSGFVHDEALANEAAARFHDARGFATIADVYWRNARYAYVRWGAFAKVQQIDRAHPHLAEEPAPLQPTSTIGAPLGHLDLETVLRASQAVSAEIDLEKLIHTLLVTALAHAGATRGVLLQPRGDELRVAAEATTSASAVGVELRDAPVGTELLPGTVLHYVARTHESVIVHDASTLQGAFAADPYLRGGAARSLLCLPLVKQGSLIGVLYLENALASRVFTPERLAVLDVIASQAAVSLDNARLYSELRDAERTVRRAEQELRLAIDSLPGLIWTARGDGVIDSVNQRLTEFLGVASEADAARGWPFAMHPDDLATAFTDWERHLESGEPYEREVRMRRGDGEYRWMMLRAVPMRDDTGRIVRWYGASIDIQDRKLAEERLQQEEHELRQLVDFIPQKIAVLSPEGRFLHANRTMLEFVALTIEEMVGADDIRPYLCHPEDLERLRETVRLLPLGVPREVEIRLRRYDGTFLWHLIRYEPLRGELGRVTRWYATATDIEQRKQAEERLQEENLALREEVDKASMFEEIVGVSAPLRTVVQSIAKVAPTESTVLVTGETGTGKELVARAIHKRSGRASRAFVSVNCAAIPAPLIASELFGHEKGAFTGALQRRLGRFELADGGTIFLDEIGDLPPDTQLALLRVLQEREFERVGGNRPIKVDVRVIAATNRDLHAAMADGSFRSDLFYRLNVFPIALPPLRERIKDIPLLVAYFVERYGSKAGKSIRHIDKRTLELLESYRWPGNIRELQNVIERAVIVCDGDTLVVDESWLSHGAADAPAARRASLTEEIVSRERQMIEEALAECNGRVSGPRGAAVKLGIPASTLDSKIRALGIQKSRFRVT